METLGAAENRTKGRLPSLAAVVALVACHGEPEGQPEERDPAIEIRFLSVEAEHAPLFDRVTGNGVIRVTKRSGRELGIWGVNGVEPVYRTAVRSDEQWIEAEPTWIECATGLSTGILLPGSAVDVDVFIPSDEHEFRFAFGTWENPDPDALEPRVGWEAWDWVWSEPIVLREAVRQ